MIRLRVLILKMKAVNILNKNTLIILLLLLVINPMVAQIKLLPWVGLGAQSIHYTSKSASVDGASGVNFGVDGYYYFNEHMALGAGLRMGSYEATAKFGSFSLEQFLVDMDGDSYVLTSSSNGIEELHKISTIEIPILFRYEKWISNSILLFGATGPVFVLPRNVESNFVSGDLVTSGYYPEWDLTITNVEEYGYYTRDLKGEMPSAKAKTTLAWALEAGGEFFISKRMNLVVSLYYQPGLSSITDSSEESLMPDAYTFNGSLMGANGVKLSKMGIRVGVNFDLTPKEKEGIKSIR